MFRKWPLRVCRESPLRVHRKSPLKGRLARRLTGLRQSLEGQALPPSLATCSSRGKDSGKEDWGWISSKSSRQQPHSVVSVSCFMGAMASCVADGSGGCMEIPISEKGSMLLRRASSKNCIESLSFCVYSIYNQ